MSEELFDIVDENNQSLGFTKTRSEAHQGEYWHRTVHLYLVNKVGQFLVHLRSPHKDHAPNCWDTRFGGHLKAGLDYLNTAIEELKEEVGLTVTESDLIIGKIYKHDGVKNKEFNQVYYYLYDKDIAHLKFNDNEVIEVKWLTPDEIIKSMLDNPDKWTNRPEHFTEIYNYFKTLNI